MPTTPVWSAAVNGLTGNLDATNASTQVSQFLGTHTSSDIYTGSQIVPSGGGTNFVWVSPGNGVDLDQPFVLPAGQTTLGRVTIPIYPHGSGADLLVTLWPDNGSGAPNTSGSPLSSTLLPASWITNLAASTGLGSGSALTVPKFNTLNLSGGVAHIAWAPPTSGQYGVSATSSGTTSGNYMISVGGSQPTVSTPSPVVVTSQYLGSGVVALSVAQPSIPQGVDQSTVTTTPTSVVVVGGTTNTSAITPTANVWVSGWDSNTGVISNWSSQAALPQAVYAAGSTSWGNSVYVIGGINSTFTAINTVYYASVSNGQISSWNTAMPLPTSVFNPIVGAVNNWLIVAGGFTTTTTTTNSVYYARINTDGSLGAWISGPLLPVGMASVATGWSSTTTDSSIITLGGTTANPYVAIDNVQILTVTDSGPSDHWVTNHWPNAFDAYQFGSFNRGNGNFDIIGLGFIFSQYVYTSVTPVPTLSVPLKATGLTAGSTYHVVMQQQQNGSSLDYIRIGFNTSSLPNDALRANRYSSVWTTVTTGYSIPVSVYNTDAIGNLVHTWDDSTSGQSKNTSTTIKDWLDRPFGLCESTVFSNNPLDVNPTFTTGTTPWVATNCTLTQSSAQTHGGYPFSGLMTPNGTSATVYVSSELIKIVPGQWYQAQGWLYSPTGWSNVSLSINWFDSAGGYLSTSSSVISLTAATWTQVINNFQAPATAAQATIVPTEGGTPAASNTLYLSYITFTNSIPSAMSSVAQINYNTSGNIWQATSVTQLATVVS